MKQLYLTICLFFSSLACAGTLDVHCGEVLKVKAGHKLHPLWGRIPAIKIKIKESWHFVQDDFVHSDYRRRYQHKYGFSDQENYEKTLGIMQKAVVEKARLNRPVFVCIGKVTGLDRWHKVGEYSLKSRKDALNSLLRRYGTKPIRITF